MVTPSLLSLGKDGHIAYCQHVSTHNVHLPGIIFLGGFMSDMEGTKATALHRYCIQNDYNFIRFDYFGHGKSSRTFTEGTIGLWRDNTLAVLDKLTQGPQILIGSSMGGWIMLLVTLLRQERIAGLVGIAAAPDFTEQLIWNALPEHAKVELQAKGIYDLASEYSQSPYPITLKLIDEARQHLILDTPIPITCPVRLIHGMKDDDVPYTLSIELTKQLKSNDVNLTLVKNGDHRMASPGDVALLSKTLEETLAICGKGR